MSMPELENLTKKLAETRAPLKTKVSELLNRIAKAQSSLMPFIRKRADAVLDAEAVLKAAIETQPELFKRPKTHTFFGIKIGFRKQAGKLEYDDAVKVVELIKKHFPKKIATLTRNTIIPDKEALEKLTAKALKKIGVRVTSDTEVVFVKPVDGDIDKHVNALLKNTKETGDEAA